MANSVVPRDVGPLLKAVRNFLLGRDLNKALRFQNEVATRSPPQPILPDGPHHKHSANYYYTRDARREVKPSEVIAMGAARPAIAAGETPAKAATKLITPGPGYVWKKPSSA